MKSNTRIVRNYSGKSQQQIKVNRVKENKASLNTPIIIHNNEKNNTNIKLNEMILNKIKKIKPNNLLFSNSYFKSNSNNIVNNSNNADPIKNNNTKNFSLLEKQHKKLPSYEISNKNVYMHKKYTSQKLETNSNIGKNEIQYENQTQIITNPNEINKYIMHTSAYNNNDINKIIYSSNNKRKKIFKKNISISPESNEKKANINNSISKAEKKSITTYKSCYNFYNEPKSYDTRSYIRMKKNNSNIKSSDDEKSCKKNLKKRIQKQKSIKNYYKNNLLEEFNLSKLRFSNQKLLDKFCFLLEEFIFYNVKKNFDFFVQNLRKISHKQQSNYFILLKRLYNKPIEKNYYTNLCHTMNDINNPPKKLLKNQAISAKKMFLIKNGNNEIFKKERNSERCSNKKIVYIPKKMENGKLNKDHSNSLRKATTVNTYIKKRKINLNDNIKIDKNKNITNKRKSLKNSLFSIINKINDDYPVTKMEKLNQTNDEIINSYTHEQTAISNNSLNKNSSNKQVYCKKIKYNQNKNKLHNLLGTNINNLSPDSQKCNTCYNNSKKNNRVIRYYTKKNGGINKSPLFEKINFLKEMKNNKNNGMSNNNKEIIKEIIVKDVSTKDKRLNVFIKYVSSNKSLKAIEKQKKINSKYNNGYLLRPTSIINFNILASRISNKNISNKTNFYLNNFNKNKLGKILTAIIEEEERSRAPNSINNSIISDDNNKNYNNYFNQSVKYITNYLQNILDDKKRGYAYDFIKILKKIKNNSFLNNLITQKKNCALNNNKINGGDNGEVIIYGGGQTHNRRFSDENNLSLLSDGERYCYKRKRFSSSFEFKNNNQGNLYKNLSYATINDSNDKGSLEVVIKKVSKKK